MENVVDQGEPMAAAPQASSPPTGKRNVYTINMTSTVFFTIAGFYLMYDNIFGNDTLFMFGMMLLCLDILLNVFIFNPRLTYKIPLICAATMAAVSISMTFIAGPRDFSTSELDEAFQAFLVVFASYLVLASAGLGLRRKIVGMPLM